MLAKIEFLEQALCVVYSEEMNNEGLSAEERGRVGHASKKPTVELLAALHPILGMLGVTRLESSTVRALRAVFARHLAKEIYSTDEKAWRAHSVSRRSFATWKKRVWKMEIEMGKRMPTSLEVAAHLCPEDEGVASRLIDEVLCPIPVKPPCPLTACDHPVYDTRELLGCERPDGNVRPGSQNDDGSRKDGFLHEPMSRFKAAKRLVKNEGILTELSHSVIQHREARGRGVTVQDLI